MGEVVRNIAADHDGDLILLITHREGIWSVLQTLGVRMKTGYCNVTHMNYDLVARSLEICKPDLESVQRPQPSSFRCGVRSSVDSAVAKATTKTSFSREGGNTVNEVIHVTEEQEGHMVLANGIAPAVSFGLEAVL